MTLRHIHSGKVRDVYDAGPGRLLFVASDRISAFDVVMAEPVPDKGRVLTAMTAFWLELLAGIPNHLISLDPDDFPPEANEITDLAGRAMLVHRAEMLPIECIVRGYLSGSAWKEYQMSGTVHGVALPSGLVESDRLPEPLFSPSTKATEGHDENITFEAATELVGREAADAARRISLAAYDKASGLAAERGIILADTKFELGYVSGELSLCDEVLTSDSSRFWPSAEWQPGCTPPSLDKQPVRDWPEGSGWDKRPPPPSLPAAVVESSRQRYITAYERLTGLRFAAWPGAAADHPDPAVDR